MIPKLMLTYLAMVCTSCINWFPAKGGISSHCSPHVLLNQRDVDYKKHCTIALGQCVQAHNDPKPKNTNAPRTLDAIYLRPSKNKQGGHELMDLSTGRLITRCKVKKCPITPMVIKAVETMAAKQGMTSLKFTNRVGVPLHPSDWIPGVDFMDGSVSESDDASYTPSTSSSDENEDFDDSSADDESLDAILAEPPSRHVTPAPAAPVAPPAIADPVPVVTQDEEPAPTTRRSTRIPPPRIRIAPTWTGQHHGNTLHQTDNLDPTHCGYLPGELEKMHNLCFSQTNDNDASVETPSTEDFYTPQSALLIARTIADINMKVQIVGASFGQQYILPKGLKKFGKQGRDATHKELDQLHRRACFTPIDVSQMTPSEKKKAQQAIVLLTEKRDGTIKGRCVHNGKPTREWLSREDAASPTASQESIFLTAVVDAKESRDTMTADVPNAFIQANMPSPKQGEDRVIMKITGILVDLLIEIAPDVYSGHAVYENGKKVLYVEVLKALYDMLISSMLWYKKFRADLEDIGFVFNPYDPCVANSTVNGKQHTIRIHVDDLMSSHVDPDVNTKFLHWLNKMHGQHGEVKATRGPRHDYLGMIFDFSEKGKVKIDMTDYVTSMVNDFSGNLSPDQTRNTPAAEDLFAVRPGEPLPTNMREEFHSIVAKALFVCKRARPDLHTTIAVLSTCVQAPTTDDWRKLTDFLKYCNGTKNEVLTLSADDLHVLKWMVDAAFAVHPDFRSHTGGHLSYGTGTIHSQSRKQKLNTGSSTEAELVGADDMSVMVLWTKLFMEAQGYEITKNILYQDNKRTILLEKNGKKSSTKRTRALNIRYFFLTDQIDKGNLCVECCPTDHMIGDFFSKPLQGNQFRTLKKIIMGN